MRQSKTHRGFILLETIVALGLLFMGLLSFEGMEIMMQRREQRMLTTLKVARQRYESTYLVLNHA